MGHFGSWNNFDSIHRPVSSTLPGTGACKPIRGLYLEAHSGRAECHPLHSRKVSAGGAKSEHCKHVLSVHCTRNPSGRL